MVSIKMNYVLNTTFSQQNLSSSTITPTQTTTTLFYQSNLYLIYTDCLKYFFNVLACLAGLIFIINIYTLVTLLLCKDLNKHLKLQYIIQISINIAIGSIYDITVVLATFIYNCFSTYLINNFVYYNIFNIDLLNVYICVLHNYLISVIEFIWMWNCVNFTTQRCLVICFPFYRVSILKWFSWPIYLIEIIFSMAMWCINIYSYSQGFFVLLLSIQNVIIIYPICFNSLEIYLLTWGYTYNTIASQYFNYGIPELLITMSNIILIIKMILASKNRKKITNLNKSQQNYVQTKLTIVVIITSCLYILITTPIMFNKSILIFVNPTDFLYIISSILTNFNGYVGKACFVLLRWADFLILLFTITEFRNLFFRVFKK